MDIPLIENLRLQQICNNLSQDFRLKKTTDIGTIFGYYKRLQRLLDGSTTLEEYDCDNLINRIECCAEENGSTFAETMMRWFPSLSSYQTAQEIKIVLKANLLGKAPITTNALQLDTELPGKIAFLQECLKAPSPVIAIKLAAHTGFAWYNNNQKNAFLKDLALQGINIQVIGNSQTPIMQKIMSTMKDPEQAMDYFSANTALARWHTYEKTYPSIKLRVCEDYPILHQSLIVEFEDGSIKALIQDYTYGSYPRKESEYYRIVSSEKLIHRYISEFEYLWNHSKIYSDWLTSLPEPEEHIEPCNYILMYPAHALHNNDSPQWIYSDLAFGKNNSVTLHSNIVNPHNTLDAEEDYEYSYQGHAEILKDNIYVTLYDEHRRERINISFARPMNNMNRLIGILTGLDPQGYEHVAFKCICIKASLLSKIDYEVLETLLSNNSTIWQNNTLVLERKDIQRFYSKQIFSCSAPRYT